MKKRLITTNRCNGFNGAAHPLCGNKPWGGLFVFCAGYHEHQPVFVEIDDIFRLFRYTLDRGIIEVNVGVEVRLDKPKTRISYADTRVFVGGVREI